MEENVVVEKEGISFSDIWNIIKKYWIGLASITAGAMLIGILVAFLFIPKQYEASEVVTCMSKGNSQVVSVEQARQNLEIAYEFVLSNDNLKETSEKLKTNYNIDISYKELKSTISVVKNSEYKMTYYYKSNIKENVPKVLNTFTECSEKYVSSEFEDIELHRVNKEGVKEEDVDDVSTSKTLVIGASVVVGAVIGLCYEFIANSLDKTIKSKKYIEEAYGIKVIGMIPDLVSPNEKEDK